MAAWIDRALLQRIRIEIAGWTRGPAEQGSDGGQPWSKAGRGADVSELVILGTRPAKLDRHMRHLLNTGELRGVVVRAAGRRVVLAKSLTPKGLTAMMERAADEEEKRHQWRSRLNRLGTRALEKLAASAWQTAAAVVLALALSIFGLSG